MGALQRRSARYPPCSARGRRAWRLWSLVLLLACLPARGEPPDEMSPPDHTPGSLELTQFEASLAGAKVDGTTLLDAPSSAKMLPTTAPAPAVPVSLVNGRVEDSIIVISTIDGGVETLDARTGISKDVFPSGPALMSSSFFTKTGGIVPRGDARNQYFVLPDLDGSIQCYRADGTKEILASNIFDLLESPIVSCLDYDDNCGLIFAEKTTKIFAVDRQSGKVQWVNIKPDMVRPEGMSGDGGGKGDAPILLQRDDYIVRSLNVRDGHEEWNVTLSDIFAIDASESEGSNHISTTEDLALVPEWQWSEDVSKRNPIILRMVHPESQKELWKHELSALPTSIYMVKDNRWLPLEVPDKVLSIAGPRREGVGRALTMDNGHKGGWGAPKSASPGLPLPQPLLLPPTSEPSDGGGRKGVSDRDIITLRKMKDMGLLESRTGPLGPWSRRKKMHPRALAMLSSSGTCGEWESAKRGQCPSRLSPAIEHLMPGRGGNSNHHQMCAGEERCEAIVPAGEHGLLQYGYEYEDVTASWSGSSGMCSPREAEPLLIDQLKVRPENKLLQTGMFLTFETLATLVIVVFIIGIGFVLVISGYQDRAQGERTLDPRVLLEELMHRHTSAKYEMITAPPITPSTSETITDCDQPSQNSLRASSEPNRVVGRCDDTEASQQLAIVPLFQGDDSLTSGPQSARPRWQPPGALLKTAAAAATATVELHRCHSLPSMPPLMPPRGSGSETFDVDRHASRGIVGGRARTVVTLGAGGRIIEHKFDNSMEGEPLQRVPAIFRPPTPKKASNSTFSPLRPDRATAFPRVLAAGCTPASIASTGNHSPRVDQGSGGSGTPTSAMVVRLGADANGGATPKQVISSPTKPPSLAQNTSETAMVTATTIETISDSSGQPILFLSTSRYKNEFRELCKLGKGGFGTVFKSANKLDGHEYAIKKIRLSSAMQWSHQLEKVLREVKILALLEHPNIIRYHQAWLERVPEEELHIVHCNASTTDQSFSDFFHHDDSDYLAVDDLRLRSRRLTDSAAYNISQSQNGWGGVGVLSPIPTRMTHAGRRRRMSSSLVEFGSSGPGLPRSPATREGSPSLDGSVGFKQGVGGVRGGQGAGGGDDDKSRMSEWSQEEDEEDDAMSEYSEVDGKSELDDDSGHPIVFARDMEDVGSSRPRTPSSSGAGGVGFGSSVFSGQNGHSSSAPRGKAAGAGGVRGRDQHRGRGRRGAGRHSSKDHAIVFDLCLYIQMQYCSNRTLKDFLEIAERLNGVDKAQALQFALQIARGVKYVHERGLIHRDLKPTNCFLVGEGSIVKIGDFGLSRHIGPPGAEPTLPGSSSPSPMSRRMQSLQFVEYDNTAGVGTPVYGSPEQLSGGDYDEKTDIFSLGVMLFELFHTGFATGMERLVVMRKLHDGQLPEEWVRSEPELTDLVMRMLNRSPSRRPGAPDVVAKLEFLQGKPLVLPLDFDSFPRDAVLVRAETQERDGVVQEVMKTVKGHGGGGLMKQYAFRSTSEGRAVIEVLLDGSRLHEIENVVGLLRQVSGVDSVKMLGHAKNALPPPMPTPVVTAS